MFTRRGRDHVGGRMRGVGDSGQYGEAGGRGAEATFAQQIMGRCLRQGG